jgi:translation initiation factor IF-2
MNISELARKLKTTNAELFEHLPKMGFDIGKRAIKVDDKIVARILRSWGPYKTKIADQKKKELEQKKIEEIRERGPIKIPAVITVRDFASKLDLPVTKILAELMKNGIVTSLNEKLDFDTTTILAEDMGIQVILDEEDSVADNSAQETLKTILSNQSREQMIDRAPTVVIMGHVDHGKTKLLDTIRDTHILEGESGGITQHIGAYQAWATPKGNKKEKKVITFIDTPGHEAFTTMRSRGAKIADIAVLVVAADDGVMTQTIEAYKIIEQAKLPVIVAINKIDKPGVNIEKVKQELSTKLNLLPEEWGGKTICVEISAKNHTNIDQLLEMILLVAEMEQENIKANPNTEAAGTVIEAHISKDEGPVSTIIIQNGTLKIGDYIIVKGTVYGKIKTMKDFRGETIREALPSMPVKILGLKIAPQVGDIVQGTANAKIDNKDLKKKKFYDSSVVGTGAISFQKNSDEDTQNKKVTIILKADMLGSLEAIIESIQKIEHPEVKISIISKALGNINESDVMRAESSNAVILGFHVQPTTPAKSLAKAKNVEINCYAIIYELLEYIRQKVESMISPEIIRHDLGKLKILAIFRHEKNDNIVGGVVTQGLIKKDAKINVWRNGEMLGSAKLASLKSGKEEVSEVDTNQQCGVLIEYPEPILVGDVIEFYQEEKKKVKLK